MSRRFWFFGMPVIVIVAGVGAAWTLMAREHPPGDPGDAEQVAIGQALYGWNCARCHGEDGGGELGWVRKETGLSEEDILEISKNLADVAPAHDASGDTARHGDDTLFRIIREGPDRALNKPDSRMPAFNDQLHEDEIWAIIAFMKSKWSEDEIAAN